MDIKYQTLLNNNTTYQRPGSDFVKRLQSISMDEIIALENTYNGGQPFPISLRELLFLAGSYCYVMDYGIYDSQDAMQIGARYWITRFNQSITRPFFVVDAYNMGDQFLFVYLDEDQNDPVIYEAYLPDNDNIDFIRALGRTLSEYVNYGMKELLNGQNPF